MESGVNYFASSSKLLQQRWAKENHRRHRQKLNAIKKSGSSVGGLSSISSTKPSASTQQPAAAAYPHLTVRLKKLQIEEERQASIDRENRRLVEKLNGIFTKPSSRIDHWNSYESNQLQLLHRSSERQRRQRQIMENNRLIASRLVGVKPNYALADWEKDYRKHKTLQGMLDCSTKDYYYVTKGQDPYGSSLSEEASLHSARDQEQQQQHSAGFASESQLSRHRQQQQSCDLHCRMLMKLCDRMGQAEEILTECLASKEWNRRERITARFRELYEQDLQQQLLSVLDSEFHCVVEALLTHPQAGAVAAAHRYLKEADARSLLTLCLQREPHTMKSLAEAYHRHYSSTLEADSRELLGHEALLVARCIAGQCKKQQQNQEELQQAAIDCAAAVTRDAAAAFSDEGDGGLLLSSISRFGVQVLPKVQQELLKPSSAGCGLREAAEAAGVADEVCEVISFLLEALGDSASAHEALADRLLTLLKSPPSVQLVQHLMLIAQSAQCEAAVNASLRRRAGSSGAAEVRQLIADSPSCGPAVGCLIALLSPSLD